MPGFSEDVALLRERASRFPIEWDGRSCTLEMKEHGGRWRDMEWIGWYFEYLCRLHFKEVLTMPSERCRRCRFDGFRSVNWDFKAKAIKSDDHRAILNDKDSMDLSIDRYGAHGLVLALLDVEYNDENRAFQRWHTKLKGGKSQYELQREQRTAVSRYRKTRATLTEILLLRITPKNRSLLAVHRQGRNSNGKPRPPKYMLDLENLGSMLSDRITIRV